MVNVLKREIRVLLEANVREEHVILGTGVGEGEVENVSLMMEYFS